MDTHSTFQLFMFVKIAKFFIIAVYLWNLLRKAKHVPVIKRAPYDAWMFFIALILFFDGMSWPIMWNDLMHAPG